jgi:competence protein ComEA
MSGPSPAHRWRGYIGLSLGWLALLGAALFIMRRPSGQPIEILPPPTVAPTATSVPSPTPGPLHVDVAGAVQSPGVYRLPAGSIVADAIGAAGGPASDADLDRINKAVALQDGTQVYVPRVAEAVPPLLLQPAVRAAATVDLATAGFISGSLINLNTATAKELESLPGVGETIAQRIVAGRPYGAIEDLMRVKGIGQATFNKLKGLVTVQ